MSNMDKVGRLLVLLFGLAPAVASAQTGEAEPQVSVQSAPQGPAPPGPAPPAPPPVPLPAAPPPASQEVIYRGEATSILGRPVTGPDRGAVGRIVDVLVDEAGQPRAVVIELGGFMGVGTRRIAVAWRALRFAPGAAGRDAVTLEMTVDQVRATPEYKPAGRPVTVAAPPAAPPAVPARPEAEPSGQP